MPTESFKAASERAEGWIHFVHMVGRLGESGSVDAAYRLLARLQDDYLQHSEVLEAEFGRLAALSDAPVNWGNDRGWRFILGEPGTVSCWSSAHEAADGIARLALEALFWPLEGNTDPAEQWTLAERLLTERWKAIAIPADEVAALQERICRERAKLLDIGDSGTAPEAGHDATPAVSDAPQYVTRDQIAGIVQRNKDVVADWLNKDEQAPKPAVEGGGGKRYEYLWHEVRPWLEGKSGRMLPERFPELRPS